MKTFTETFRRNDGDKVKVYLNVHEDENYTGVGVYLNDTCASEKKLHGIYTLTSELPEYAVNFMLNAILETQLGRTTEEFVDCKFID